MSDDTATRPGPVHVDLSGTVAVVIGASQGIGRAIALTFAGAGATVVAAARATSRLAEVQEAATLAGGIVLTEVVDVTDPHSITRLADDVADRVGAATVLVNSAGVMLAKKALEVTPEEWDLVHDTQLRGTFFACQAFGRQMARAGYGKIINLSSTWAVTTGPGRSVYSAAKAGVGHLTSALAIEWAPAGVRVNAIAPTSTLTPTVQTRLENDPARESYLIDRIPLGRLANTADLTGAALFLASSSSDFVTGETLFVDGGWRTYR